MTVAPPVRTRSNGFLKNVAAVAGGAAASQLIALLALPIITRLYLPEHYGVLSIYAGVLGLLAVIACLRFENAITLPRSQRAAIQIGAISLLALFFISTLSLIGGVAFVAFFSSHIGGMNGYEFILFLFVGLVGAGLYQIGTAWCVRSKNFYLIGKTRFHQAIVSTSTQLLLGFFGFGAVGLILGQLISQTTGFFALLRGLFHQLVSTFPAVVRVRRICWGMNRYVRFPVYDAPAALLNSASTQFPAIFFAAWFSPALAGYYALSIRLLSAPVGLIGVGVSQALTPKLVESIHSRNVPLIMGAGFRFLFGIGAIPFALFISLAPSMFSIAFGDSWAGAGEVSAWTAAWLFLQFVYGPLSIYLVCAEAQRLNLAIQVMFFLIRFVPLFFVYLSGSKFDPVIAFSIASILCYLFGLVVLAHFSGSGALFVLGVLIKETSIAALIGFAAWMAKKQDLWTLLLFLLFAGGVYFYRLRQCRQNFMHVLG